MEILGQILKHVDLDADDILDVIHRFSPTLAFVIAAIFGIGGIIFFGIIFYEYMQM